MPKPSILSATRLWQGAARLSRIYHVSGPGSSNPFSRRLSACCRCGIDGRPAGVGDSVPLTAPARFLAGVEAIAGWVLAGLQGIDRRAAPPVAENRRIGGPGGTGNGAKATVHSPGGSRFGRAFGGNGVVLIIPFLFFILPVIAPFDTSCPAIYNGRYPGPISESQYERAHTVCQLTN